MKIFTKKVPTSFNLFLFGDTHLGGFEFAEDRFQIFLDTVASDFEGVPAKHNYLVDHGDSIEALTIDDKRYDARVATDPRGTPLDQVKDYVKMVGHTYPQTVAKLMGNHEWYLRRFGNLVKEMCGLMGSEDLYGTAACKVIWMDHKDELIFKSFHAHGRKQITSTADDPKRRKTNMELILKRQLKFKAGDCLVMSKGHTHKLLVCRPESEMYLVDDGQDLKHEYTHSHRAAGYIHPDHRWYVNVGSFRKTFIKDEIGYAEMFEYDPMELGYVVVMVRDRIIEDVRPMVLAK